MKHLLFSAVTCLLSLTAWSLEPMLLDDLSRVKAWSKNTDKIAVAAAEGPAAGVNAITVSNLPAGTAFLDLNMDEAVTSTFDRYQGISFQIKGDGSDCWAPVCLRMNAYTYLYFVPLKSTEWTSYAVPWKDFVPEGQTGLITEHDGVPPCGLTGIRIGCRWNIWYNNDRIPAHALTIANIRLEPVVKSSNATRTPAPFKAFLDKLASGKPVLVQCQGDSITAGTSLADKKNERYSIQAQRYLSKWLGRDNIRFVNRAVGGAKVNNMRGWLNRDFAGEVPDLVTIWCGYNDKSGAYTPARYKQNISEYIDAVAQVTQGRSAVLIIAPGPGTGPRFTMMDDFADAMRELARERKLPCLDINATLKALGKRDFTRKYMADMAHPNATGHQAIAEALCKFLVKNAGITTPEPAKPEVKVVPGGSTYACDFEDGAPDWRLNKYMSISEEKASSGKKSLKLFVAADDTKVDYQNAWSPAVPVQPGQVYSITCEVCGEIASPNVRVFVSEYPDAEGKVYKEKLKNIYGKAPYKWGHCDAEYVVPEGVGSIRILFWGGRTNKGAAYLDNLCIKPANAK